MTHIKESTGPLASALGARGHAVIADKSMNEKDAQEAPVLAETVLKNYE
jgi:hypothetical protein